MGHGDNTIDRDAIGRLLGSMRRDIEADRYDGAVVSLVHRGEVVLEEALGWTERDRGRVARTDDVFRVLSLTKAFTVVLVLKAVEEGLLAFTTPVVDVIPEFRGTDKFLDKYRTKLSVMDLLTHRSGLPATPEPVGQDRLGDLRSVVAAICAAGPIAEPGETIDYSPAANHALLGEMVRRVRGAAHYRDLVREQVFGPLGMQDSAIGAPRAWADRIVPLRAKFSQAGWLTGADIESLNGVVDEDAELPWVGSVTTAHDVARFAEMLRCGGALDGTRIVSTAVLDRALRNHTGDQLNNWWIPMTQRRGWKPMPANLGLGFFLRGEGLHPSILGTLTSPGTFGNYGAGSSLYWVDPERELTLVCLTAGIMEESQNIERFQRLSDLAVSSVVRRERVPVMA
ncbi:CubicO group peptidase, beta-lactamase class C family [Raineyella antarctica]|uniref:CubicO group peptidase, beta-lactamase class C family n=1 Tax=Raineyella antarctica TaxID=1577474 RepID=A0A1G6HPI3_9ACTN|nr:serine hydrolase domain-containing protein [Raineyella antarctica]SDB96189.1 CubicO group peptidase, beta-lactamase class C family [Raineyella antarctica]